MDYHEYFDEDLENVCMCVWSMKSKTTLLKDIDLIILPDASIDIIVNNVTKKIYISAYSKHTKNLVLNHDVDYIGIRFKPNGFYKTFGIEASEVMDHHSDVSLIDPQGTLQEVFSCQSHSQQFEILKNFVNKHFKDKEDIYDEIVNRLYQLPSSKTVEDIAKECGYSKRQLNRLFKIHYGLSPKVLLNILRLHYSLDLILNQNMSLLDIAMLCGYYDQSHFIKDIEKYTGISPEKIMSQIYN